MSSSTQYFNQKYEQLAQIGKGSFGVVKKVRRLADNKILVWKEMNYSNMSSRQKQQLVTEVNVLKQLNHPYIVKYEDRMINNKERKVFIVMEYCSGGDLASYIKQLKTKKQFIPEDVIWKFVHQIILALNQCHNRKIIHRDIKPANIFLDEHEDGFNANLKLGDFGLSRQLGEYSEFAQTNVGTPYYMSPEQVKQSRYNEKSDIWSTGCIIYEIASLRRPFEASNPLALAEKISRGKFQRIPLKYSQTLQHLIERMLMIDPEKRISTSQILKIQYLAIRDEQKMVKKKLSEVKIKEQQLMTRKLKLLRQIKETEEKNTDQSQRFYINQKDNKLRKSQNLRQQEWNKENIMSSGNITDRY